MKLSGMPADPGGTVLFRYQQLIQLTLALYLLFNIYINSSILLTYNQNFFFPLLFLFFLCLVAVRNSSFLFFLLFVFSVTFFFFGFHSYDVQSRVFELAVALLSIVLLMKYRNSLNCTDRNHFLSLLFLCYCCLALCSLFLLPLQDIFAKIRLWGIHDFSFFVLNATPELPEYSIAAVNRLFLFSVTACLLAYSGKYAEKYFHYIFSGAVLGLVLAAIIGLLEFFNMLSLAWYVPGSLNKLHSMFLNRGWYSEYAICLTPLLFLGICRFPGRLVSYSITFIVLVVVGVSILFTGARSGWGLFAVLLAGSSFIFVGQGNLRQKMFKSMFFFSLVILLLFTLSFSIFKISQVQDEPGERSPKSMSAKQVFLQKRLKNLFQTGRIKNWQDTVQLIDGRILFGRGYESFSRQSHILAGISSSDYKQSQQHLKIRDTAHNFYLQLVVSNGIYGLILWLFLFVYASFVLFKDYKSNNSCESMVVLTCIIAFHLYGLTQSMQYVPMIWFLIFLFFGYAMMREKVIGMQQQQKKLRLVMALSASGCLVAVSSYAFNVGMRQEADRYGLEVFAVDQDLYRYKGFYKKELWPEQGTYRWTGRQAEIVLDKYGRVGFDFACYAPRLADEPIILDVLLDGVSLDQYTFAQAGTVRRTYLIQQQGDVSGKTLKIKVSRTWNPRSERVSTDLRNLGVAVSEPKWGESNR